jgi:hypothetical protein
MRLRLGLLRMIVGVMVGLMAWTIDVGATFDTGTPTIGAAQARRHRAKRKRRHRRRRKR